MEKCNVHFFGNGRLSVYVLDSHLEGSSTSVGRPGNCHSPVIAVENVDIR